MNEPDLNAGLSRPEDPIRGEYQDPHYHDEDDVLDIEEGEGWHRSVPARKKPSHTRRMPPPRPRYLDD